MARQIILSTADLGGLLPDAAVDILAFMGSPLHTLDVAVRMIERASNMARTLVNQTAYPMMLQTSHEFDRLMYEHLPKDSAHIGKLNLLLIPLTIANPLGGVVYEDLKQAYWANYNAYDAISKKWYGKWEWITRTVEEVVDGDSFRVREVLDDPKLMDIRIEQCNCPEIWHVEKDPDGDPDDPRYAAGYAAKDYTTSRLIGTEVELRARRRRDFWDRVIAKVFIDGESFATELVKEGHAVFYPRWFPDRMEEKYL